MKFIAEGAKDFKIPKLRLYFDTLISQHPVVKHHLKKYSDVVRHKDFDNAVVNIQLVEDEGKITNA